MIVEEDGAAEEVEERACQQPCDPDRACDECEHYWWRMSAEGYWDRAQHRWTEKGWKEIAKWP